MGKAAPPLSGPRRSDAEAAEMEAADPSVWRRWCRWCWVRGGTVGLGQTELRWSSNEHLAECPRELALACERAFGPGKGSTTVNKPNTVSSSHAAMDAYQAICASTCAGCADDIANGFRKQWNIPLMIPRPHGDACWVPLAQAVAEAVHG